MKAQTWVTIKDHEYWVVFTCETDHNEDGVFILKSTIDIQEINSLDANVYFTPEMKYRIIENLPANVEDIDITDIEEAA